MIDDFYSTFLAETTRLAHVEPNQCQEHLKSVLCNEKTAVYMLMYLRYLTAAHMKKNEIEFAGFVGGDVRDFCAREVEQVDLESDQPQIMALTGYLECGVEITQVTESRLDMQNFP